MGFDGIGTESVNKVDGLCNPINRENRDDLLIQIGRVQIEIREHDKKRSKIDKELEKIPKLVIYLETQKKEIATRISKKHHYIKQLENDIKNLEK